MMALRIRSWRSADGRPISSGGGARRNPDLVVRLQAGIRTGAVAVNADFTFTDYPVNTAPGDAPEVLVHEVVETLSGFLCGDLELTHNRAYFGFLLLGHITLGVRHCFYNSLASILRLPSQLLKPAGTRQWSASFEADSARKSPHVSWTSLTEAIVLGRQDAPAALNLFRFRSFRDPWWRRAVEFPEGFPAHRPPVAGIDVRE